MSKNLHGGFLDLNPWYKDKRKAYGSLVAQKWLVKIGEDIQQKVDDKYRDNFNKKLDQGNRLSVNTIGKLRPTLRGDYHLAIVKETALE